MGLREFWELEIAGSIPVTRTIKDLLKRPNGEATLLQGESRQFESDLEYHAQ